MVKIFKVLQKGEEMKASRQRLFRKVKSRDGFTLIEMLIVIIILGILAMVIIPQITVSTEDAKVSTIKTNLTGLRSAIEIYYAQHNQSYPGNVQADDGTTATTNDTAPAAMLTQLTQYTDATGKAAATKTVAYPFGPYVKGGLLPENPFNNKTDVICDISVTNITLSMGVKRVATGASGWKYLPKLGVIFANDESSLADADTPHKKY